MKTAKKLTTKQVAAKKAVTKKATKKAPSNKARKVAPKKVVAKKPAAKPAKPLAETLTDLQRTILREVGQAGILVKEGCNIRPYPTRAIRSLIEAGLLLGDTMKARLSAAGKRLFQNLTPDAAPAAV